MLQPRHATVPSKPRLPTPFLLLRITCNKDRSVNGGNDPVWRCPGETAGNPIGAAGLMASIVGWRQAFESAGMAGSDSMGHHGNIRTVNRKRRSLEHALAG